MKEDTGNFYHDHDINVRSGYGSTGISIIYASFRSCNSLFLEINAVAISIIRKDNPKWNSLRFGKAMQEYLIWEPVDKEKGIYHLAIRGDCPTLATGVSNRANGDYATNDLFLNDPEDHELWYHRGRKDDTLVMYVTSIYSKFL